MYEYNTIVLKSQDYGIYSQKFKSKKAPGNLLSCRGAVVRRRWLLHGLLSRLNNLRIKLLHQVLLPKVQAGQSLELLYQRCPKSQRAITTGLPWIQRTKCSPKLLLIYLGDYSTSKIRIVCFVFDIIHILSLSHSDAKILSGIDCVF